MYVSFVCHEILIEVIDFRTKLIEVMDFRSKLLLLWPRDRIGTQNTQKHPSELQDPPEFVTMLCTRLQSVQLSEVIDFSTRTELLAVMNLVD